MSWQQKFDNGQAPKVVTLDRAMGGLPAGSRLLISSPSEVESYLREIPAGSVRTTKALRDDLARRHAADGTCALTTGIFLRIVSELNLEQRAQGTSVSEMAPFWRVIDPKSPLAKKLSCGPEFIAQMRQLEAG